MLVFFGTWKINGHEKSSRVLVVIVADQSFLGPPQECVTGGNG